jgi:hypothetical protein
MASKNKQRKLKNANMLSTGSREIKMKRIMFYTKADRKRFKNPEPD